MDDEPIGDSEIFRATARRVPLERFSARIAASIGQDNAARGVQSSGIDLARVEQDG